jgi:hypothetical protein
MFEDIYQLPPKKVAAIEWTGDPLYYDFQLYGLGRGHKEFWVINPDSNIPTQWDTDLKFYVDSIPDTRKCIVLSHRGEWIVKIFKNDWYPYHGYETVEIIKPKMIWTYNTDFDKQITFENNPYGIHDPAPWDRDYKLIWYVDPRFNPLDEDVWVFSCQPVGRELLGTKHMGYIIPDIEVSFNELLPDLGVDINECCPPYWDLIYECAYDLDNKHLSVADKRIWVIKFKPMWGAPKDWKWIGTISPEYTVILNPSLPEVSYDIDYVIPWYDFKFEHVWMLDRKHLRNDEDDIWAFTIQLSEDLSGSKIIDHISPVIDITYNTDLPKLSYDIDYVIPWYDFKFEHVWMLDRSISEQDNIWALSATAIDNTEGVKQIATLSPKIAKQLDVIFISYYELNAEDNWQRVLEKAPWAKRVDGVTGIFEAHKAAGKLAKSDMFYVVDGDAYLSDDWQFDFQPNIFDRDCTYVWNSINPLNNLTYGFGGVKLFNKSKIRYLKSWETDLTLSVAKKLKVIETISNITKFNTSEYNTWRTAFRECAKLAKKEDAESNKRLQAWLEPDVAADYHVWAKLGAEQGKAYAASELPISNINDYDWLKLQFKGKLNE